MKPTVPKKFWSWLGLGGLSLVGLLIVHIGVGRVNLSPGEVAAALVGRPTDPLHHQIVWELRLPRALIAVVAGAMLGLAGAILQSLTGNPLAEPGLTGVTAGSILLAVLWTIEFPNAPPLATPALALVGGLAIGLAVYTLSRRRGRTNPLRLVLTGVLLGAVLNSFISLLLVVNTTALGDIVTLSIGSLNGLSWTNCNILVIWAILSVPAGLACAGVANLLQLGDEIAAGVGLPVEAARLGLLFVAALLTSGAVTTVGGIGFIGLIGPHIARRLVGSDARRFYPVGALVSALLLLTSDIISRALTQPYEIPAGSITAFLGVPFFLYLLWHKKSS